MNKIAVYRREHFNAAHRLHNPAWDDATNQLVFGKCSNSNYHGHNYELVVKIIGNINPNTGYVMDMKLLSNLIKEQVLKKFDHKNLNLDTKEFATLNPTAENIAVVIYNLLRPHIAEDLDMRITLYETEKNYVKYPA